MLEFAKAVAMPEQVGCALGCLDPIESDRLVFPRDPFED